MVNNKNKCIKFPPSILARKILCIEYLPAPFNVEERFKFQALHAMAVVKVITRHLKSGYDLKSVERGGKGYRIDLLFEAISSKKTRLVEVKSSKQLREVHKIQAALYHHVNADEYVVSNRETDEILSDEFIKDIQIRAERIHKLILNQMNQQKVRYTPHQDCCYTCGNTVCPYLVKTKTITVPYGR